MSLKPWQGRFAKSTLTEVEKFTESLSFDWKLYRYDIMGSIAHCRMLAECNIITSEESSQIITALGEIQREIERGDFVFDPSLEDIHMAIEHRLVQKVGEVGGKLHTARSRNDQIALDMRLYIRDVILTVRSELVELLQTLVDMAERYLYVIMPGYTHLQHAQPVSLGHHFMAYGEMFRRDEERFSDCYRRADVLPLGSAAMAGTTFPIDMRKTAEYLNFHKVTINSIDAVSDRDYLIEFLSSSAICMMHISRLSEELVMWSSSEFGFIEISDAYCTGSSIMPQKKNPDVAELMRGKTGRTYGNLMALLTTMKALPLAYNRDLQEDKIPVFDTAETLIATLKLLRSLLPEITVNAARMEEATKEGWILATELADYLVMRHGLPFRKAHHVVGRLVRYCIEQKKDFSDCTVEELRQFFRDFGEEVFEMLSLRKAVERRTSEGGTGFTMVQRSIGIMRSYIDKIKLDIAGFKI